MIRGASDAPHPAAVFDRQPEVLAPILRDFHHEVERPIDSEAARDEPIAHDRHRRSVGVVWTGRNLESWLGAAAGRRERQSCCCDDRDASCLPHGVPASSRRPPLIIARTTTADVGRANLARVSPGRTSPGEPDAGGGPRTASAPAAGGCTPCPARGARGGARTQPRQPRRTDDMIAASRLSPATGLALVQADQGTRRRTSGSVVRSPGPAARPSRVPIVEPGLAHMARNPVEAACAGRGSWGCLSPFAPPFPASPRHPALRGCRRPLHKRVWGGLRLQIFLVGSEWSRKTCELGAGTAACGLCARCTGCLRRRRDRSRPMRGRWWS